MGIGNRRASFIDYRNPGVFMITMNKAPGIPEFSSLAVGGNTTTPRVFVRTSSLGKIIQNELEKISSLNSKIEKGRYIIMPDHIHFVINIKAKMEQALGEYLAIWKRIVFHSAFDKDLIEEKALSLFEKGFNDQFLKSNRSWKKLNNYILSNPYRLWVRKEKPNFFKREASLILADTELSAYGNLYLLDNPFKLAVVIHRSDTPEILKRKEEEFDYAICNGGILVGAFISSLEKRIFERAYENGGRVILISNKFFGEREKPTGKLFEMCESGRLLILTPKEIGAYRPLPGCAGHRNRQENGVAFNFQSCHAGHRGDLEKAKNKITRVECLLLNSVAEKLSNC